MSDQPPSPAAKSSDGKPAIKRAIAKPVPATPAGVYMAELGGKRGWLDYHLGNGTAFGLRLLAALMSIDASVPGLGDRLAVELAQVKYVPTAENPAAWKAGFEQLVQKLAEVLVANTLCRITWPTGTTINCEPTNPNSGARPEFEVRTPNHLWLFEVKCPAFIKHQDKRRGSKGQLPVRSFMRNTLGLDSEALTLPRDNTLKDFLASAERKFAGFDTCPTTAILVVVWDLHMYEALAVLMHPEAGLLTENSWYREDNARVPFEAVNGVIVVNRLEQIKAGLQDALDANVIDPFELGGEDALPSTWCPNVGIGDLDRDVAAAFDAWPHDGTAVASDYAMLDYVMWFSPADAVAEVARLNKRRTRIRKLREGTSVVAIARSS